MTVKTKKQVYRYRLTTTRYSSRRYGDCEVCGKYCTEVYLQVEERKYEGGWTRLDCTDHFGHEKCLKGVQR